MSYQRSILTLIIALSGGLSTIIACADPGAPIAIAIHAGAVFNAEGRHEMDATIMNGANLEAGAVAGVQNIRNPILLARKVMTDSVHHGC